MSRMSDKHIEDQERNKVLRGEEDQRIPYAEIDKLRDWCQGEIDNMRANPLNQLHQYEYDVIELRNALTRVRRY